MAIKTASRTQYDIEGIIKEINQPNVKAVVYFFSTEFESCKPQDALKQAFPGAVCIGSSMVGGYSNFGAMEKGVCAMSLSSDEVAETFASFQDGVKTDPAKAARDAIRELLRKTAGVALNPDEYLGLIFFDGLCMGEVIMKEFTLEKTLNLPFVGGAAADEMTFSKTFVSLDSRLSSDGLAVVILKMKIPYYVTHAVHCKASGSPFVVTNAETSKRIVWEFDGKPAAQEYMRLTGVKNEAELDLNVFSKNPLGVKIGESIYVRTPLAVIDGKGLQFYCYIEAGSSVCILKRGDIIANSEQCMERTRRYLPRGVQGSLLFNCVVRYMELKELRKVDAFNAIFSNENMIGFNTYGEELFTHHNQTLTAVFFGAPVPAEESGSAKTRRLFHYADSKLRALSFEIVSRSELLNVTISRLNESFTPVSEYMKQGTEEFKKSAEGFLASVTENQSDIENIDKGFKVIAKEFGESFTLAEELQTSAKSVMETLAAIHNVTQITNVLALNAAIEAARAGAGGKGFAVVASEIRKHANATATAVTGISTAVGALIKTIKELSIKMDAVKREVDQSKHTVDNLVRTNKQELSLISQVNENVSSLENTFDEYGSIEQMLAAMIERSNISKEDIEKMLIVYQHNLRNAEDT